MSKNATQLQPDEFVRLIMANEGRLFGLVRALLPGCEDVEDIVQEVVTLMWEKLDEFEKGTNFSAWACRIAHFKVLEYRRTKNRRSRCLNEQVVEQLVTDTGNLWYELEYRSQALDECIASLTKSDRELILFRFRSKGTLKETARQVGRSEVTVRLWIRRILKRLESCIQRRFEMGPSA